MNNNDPKLQQLLAEAQQDLDVLAVIQFGSTIRSEQRASSDIDICLALDPNCKPKTSPTSKRLEYLAQVSSSLDVTVFQQLPLYVRQRILEEGEVLFCRDEDKLYELAFRTVQAFGDFEHIYREYLEEVAHA